MSISQNLTIELIKLQKINFGWHKVEFLKKVSQKNSQVLYASFWGKSLSFEKIDDQSH